MEHIYNLRTANQSDTDRIWEIIQQAKTQMCRESKQQWDESYPTLEHISADIANGYAYVLCNKHDPIAYAAVVFDGEPTYQTIQGNWLSEHPYVVVHRLAVSDEMKQKGIATICMQEVEKLSIEKGIRSFKVDTNFDNFGMQRILEKLRFTYCGEIIFQGGSRKAYEKLLY